MPRPRVRRGAAGIGAMEPNWAEDEREVLTRARDPDHSDHAEAVVILFADYVLPAALDRARQLPLTEESAEDLVQNVALNFWRTLARFRGDSTIRTYVTTMVENVWKDQARKMGRRQGILRIIPVPDPPGLVERDDIPSPRQEPVVLDDTTSIDVLSLCRTPELTPREQVVLLLTFVADLRTEEIADLLRVTKRTVCRIRMSAINKLRERTADDEQ